MATQHVLGGLLALTAMPTFGLATTNYDLLYNAANGSLQIDTSGGNLINYVIEGGTFNGGAHQTHLGGTAGSIDSTLSESGLSGAQGTLDLGLVLDSGLGLHDFAQRFSRASYVTHLGGQMGEFDILYDVDPSASWLDEVGHYDGYELVYHEDESIFQVIARGGWNTGTTSQPDPVEEEIVDLPAPDSDRQEVLCGTGWCGEVLSNGSITLAYFPGLVGSTLSNFIPVYWGVSETGEPLYTLRDLDITLHTPATLGYDVTTSYNMALTTDADVAVTPEPATAMLLLVLPALAFRRRRA